jgi:hypothetical protein
MNSPHHPTAVGNTTRMMIGVIYTANIIVLLTRQSLCVHSPHECAVEPLLIFCLAARFSRYLDPVLPGSYNLPIFTVDCLGYRVILAWRSSAMKASAWGDFDSLRFSPGRH